MDEKVKYYETSRNHATYFAADGIFLSLFRQQTLSGQSDFEKHENEHSARFDQLKLSFINSAANPVIEAENIQATKYNYYIGKDPAGWRENISTYTAVTYTEIYKNIDLKIYGNNRQLEYDVIVRPGGDPAAVQFQYEGANSLAVNKAGELEIRLSHGTLIQKAPSLYQEISGRRVAIAGHFKLLPDNAYTFSIASYDPTRTLIIDPVIEYSNYLSGDWSDWGNSVAVDDAGNAYVTGKTDSTFFFHSHDVATYKNDVFVYKANLSGILQYITVFGGTVNDTSQYSIKEEGLDIAVDDAGNAHVVGSTMSDDFPITSGAIQENFVGYQADAFYTVLAPSGTIVYSSYFGGIDTERAKTIAVAGSGTVCIAGGTAPYNTTHQPDFPTFNAMQPNFGGKSDGFIVKIAYDSATPANTSLIFSTYFGGTDGDGIAGIALDDAENIYITGTTSSSNLPGASLSPIQPSFAGTYDAFVAKINAAGTNIVYATYLGGTRYDIGKAIGVNAWGEASVAGDVMPPSSGGYNSFPLVNPIQGFPGGGQYDAFVTKINSTGTAIVYSTFLGGSLSDIVRDIAVDSLGSTFVAGETWSADFPIVNPIPGHATILGDSGNEMDGFITRLSPLGSTLIYSTYLGGDGDNVIGNDNAGTDSIHGIAVDDTGTAWVTGMTTSHSFPGAVGYDKLTDGFISKISDDSPVPPEISSVTPQAGAVDVPISSIVSATFMADMEISSFNGNMTLVTSSGGVPVAGTVGNNGWHVIEFTPSSSLEHDTAYTATVTTGVTDTAGTPLPDNYSWEFTTESAAPDTTPPTVISTVPDTSDSNNMVENVPVNSVVLVAFSEAMNPATITSDNLLLWSWDQATSSDIIYSAGVDYDTAAHIATIIPDAHLPYSTEIALRVSYQVVDSAGNAMGSNYYGVFKTACDPNAPTVIASSPAQNDTDIPVGAVLSFTFNNDMDPATLNATTVPVYYFGSSIYYIDGTYSYDAGTRTLTFTPASSLPYGTGITTLFHETVADTDGRQICYPSQNEPTYVYFTTVERADKSSFYVIRAKNGKTIIFSLKSK
jgi:hypothetical protein